MKEIIRLTEEDLHKIIQKSVERIVRETRNDDIVNGIENDDDEDYNDRVLNDDEEGKFLGDMNDKYQEEDSDMKEYFDDLNADQWIGNDVE